jgi:hypothetical protein
MAGLDRQSMRTRATIPAPSIQVRFSGPLPCFSPVEVTMTSDLRKLAFAAIAISGLAIGLLAATMATVSAAAGL